VVDEVVVEVEADEVEELFIMKINERK